ncbi:MAG: sulfatase-like hydrolase/transferase [Planctomycetota bacterium]
MAVASAADKPNVLVFFVDDLGWTDWQHDPVLNPLGSPVYETPNMLRLASEGVNFTNAYSSSPVCSPTRASLLTGQTPARHDFTDHSGGGSNTSSTLRSPVFTRSVAGSDTTVAEALGSPAGGYDTGFVGKWHAGGSPTSHGFDFNIAGGGAGCPCDGEGGFFAGPDGRWNMPGLSTPGTYPSDAYLTDVLSGFAEDYITQKAADPDPFFLMMAPYQVHVPLQAPADTINKYNLKISQLVGQGVDLRGHDNAIYAAMVEEMDTALGRALDRLDDPNNDGNTADSIRDDTIIVFASDNGGLTVSELGSAPATDNSPLRSGKGSLYAGGIRTTFITSWTGNSQIAQGTSTAARVSTHDLYPTLLDLTGLKDDASVPRNDVMDGVSFASALEGGSHDRGYQYFHYPHRSNQQKVGGGVVTGGSFVSAILDDDRKMIYFYETGSYEMYDLANDLGEANDLMGTDPMKAFEMSLELHAYLKQVGAGLPINRFTGQPVDLPEVLWLTEQGDFTGDGILDAADWQRLKTGFGVDVSSLDAVVAYRAGGDINLDGRVDRLDFAEFKTCFEAANGAGSFEAMLASVPEPTSGLLLVPAVAACAGRRAAR